MYLLHSPISLAVFADQPFILFVNSVSMLLCMAHILRAEDGASSENECTQFFTEMFLLQ